MVAGCDRADAARQRAASSPVDWRPSLTTTRAVKEYLNELDRDASLNRTQKSVSLTDPMSQWSGAKGPAQFFYSTNYLIDVENSVILDVEATPSTRTLEVNTTKTMIDRVEHKHGLLPRRLMGDTAYGTAENLAYLVNEKSIEPHVPVWDHSQRTDDTFSVNDFVWNADANEYRCPAGKAIKHNRRNLTGARYGVTKANTLIYRSSQKDCNDCPLKAGCCPNTSHRKIARSIHEDARDVARQINQSAEYSEQTFHQRKKVEMVFAHMKRNFKLDRLRLRGLSGASDEFLLVAMAQNLRKLARYCSQPPPLTG